jgi:nucleoside-diphosphate-sugar epimerase
VRVVITGAGGRIGRHVVAELSGTHELRLIDRVPVPGYPTFLADLSCGRPPERRWLSWRRLTSPRWERELEGADILLHLAANAGADAPWESVLRDNIQATWNVLDAAARHGIRRVVFASSCRWALGLDPETKPDWPRIKISSATATRPRTPYGLSKAWGEQVGRMFVDIGRVRSVVAVRIGSFREREPDDGDARRLWVRAGDLRVLLRRCIESEFTGFHIVYAVSQQAAGFIDLSHTRELLGWEPEKQ